MQAATKKPRAPRGPSAKREGQTGGTGQLSFWNETPSEPPASAPKKRRKPASEPHPRESREVAAKVGEEILNGGLHPAEWASALAASNGTTQQALAEYARRRLLRLGEDHVLSERKELEMEMRKLHFCGSQPKNHRRKKPSRSNHGLSLFGILLVFVGFWGLSAKMLLGSQLFGLPLVLKSAVGSAAACFLLAGIYFLSGRALKRWLTGDRILGIGAIVCGLSFASALTMMLPGAEMPISKPIRTTPVLPEETSPPAEAPRITSR